jgi:hypothetical protein
MEELKNEKVEIVFAGKPDRAAISGSLQSWKCTGFSTTFRELFPTGIIYSYSKYSYESEQQQVIFYELIQEKVVELMLGRHTGT